MHAHVGDVQPARVNAIQAKDGHQRGKRARMTTQPSAFLVRPDFPAKNIAEFVAYAKANPKKLSGGYGASSAQVAIAQLESRGGFEVLGVPYKGIPLAVVDTIGGTVDFTVGDMMVQYWAQDYYDNGILHPIEEYFNK